MEKKIRVSFLENDNDAFAHVILNESQIRLLDYLNVNDCFAEGFKYIIEENDIKWTEI